MSTNTMLTNVSTFDVSNMIFSEPVTGSIPDSTPKIEFRRINIMTKNPDGTVGDLVLGTERLFSFGVSENKSQETGKVSGWTMPLCLHSRDGATQSETEFVNTFNSIVDRCKEHLVDNREEIDRFDLEMSDLKKFNPLYYKKEKTTCKKTGKTTLKNVGGPTLYAKLIYSKKNGKFVTSFFNKLDGTELDPLALTGKYCYTRAAVKIESIFIGNKISLQVKIYEAEVEEVSTGRQRLLVTARAPPATSILGHTPSTADDDDDDGSIQGSDEEEEEEAPPPPKKKVVRKVRRVVRKAKA